MMERVLNTLMSISYAYTFNNIIKYYSNAYIKHTCTYRTSPQHLTFNCYLIHALENPSKFNAKKKG